MNKLVTLEEFITLIEERSSFKASEENVKDWLYRGLIKSSFKLSTRYLNNGGNHVPSFSNPTDNLSNDSLMILTPSELTKISNIETQELVKNGISSASEFHQTKNDCRNYAGKVSLLDNTYTFELPKSTFEKTNFLGETKIYKTATFINDQQIYVNMKQLVINPFPYNKSMFAGINIHVSFDESASLVDDQSLYPEYLHSRAYINCTPKSVDSFIWKVIRQLDYHDDKTLKKTQRRNNFIEFWYQKNGLNINDATGYTAQELWMIWGEDFVNQSGNRNIFNPMADGSIYDFLKDFTRVTLQ